MVWETVIVTVGVMMSKVAKNLMHICPIFHRTHMQMSNYPVVGSDSETDGLVEFTSDQLKHCTYAREMYTAGDGHGSWADAVDPLCVPIMTVAELRILHRFLAIRDRLGQPPKIRDTPPRIYDSEIMNRDGTGTGLNVVVYPSLIDLPKMKQWDVDHIGIDEEYMTFLRDLVIREVSPEGIDYTAITIAPHEGAVLFRWIDYADFMGCDDLLYLLRARIAYIYKRYNYAYMDSVLGDTTRSNREKIHQYVSLTDGIPYTDRERTFLRDISKFGGRHPMAFKAIQRQFIQHRGIPLPRPEWTNEEWEKFMEDAPTFYMSLPVPDKEKHRLYAKRRGQGQGQ